jgi:ankyrin repeat protein
MKRTEENRGTLSELAFFLSISLRLFGITAMALLLFSCSPADSGKSKKSQKTSKTQKKSSIHKDVERIAKGLIKSKGDLNQRYNANFKKDDSKMPILLWAVSFHDVNSVKLLLDHGADPDVPLMKGSTETPLFEAAHATDLDTAADRKMFNYRGKSAEICKLLIKAGADVKHKNQLGETALIKAAAHGREDICAILITAGADVNRVDRMGATALHAAAKRGYWKVVSLLLKNGADRSIKNRMGDSPSALAGKRSDEKLYKKCRGVLPEAYSTADYDKTEEILSEK